MPDLETIVQGIREDWTEQNHVRDLTLQRSRMLIRLCANSIRATHRQEYAEARSLLGEAQREAGSMMAEAAPFADIADSGIPAGRAQGTGRGGVDSGVCDGRGPAHAGQPECAQCLVSQRTG